MKFETDHTGGGRLPISSSQLKFLKHFQTISTPSKTPFATQPISTLTNNHDIRHTFQSRIKSYQNQQSIIDKIVSEQVAYSNIPKNNVISSLDFIEKPMLVNMDPNINYNIQRINQFFTQQLSHQSSSSDLFNLQGYVSKLLQIPLLENKSPSSMSKSINKSNDKRSTPPKPERSNSPFRNNSPKQSKQFESDLVTQRAQPRFKKVDIILMQILQQKKRKGIVTDYFRAVQMKLTNLLQFILEGETQYYGLSLPDKMKRVLKNLQSFKGKSVQGESKINLLKIFFQEFRSLKKQKEDQQRQKFSESEDIHNYQNANINHHVNQSMKSSEKKPSKNMMISNKTYKSNQIKSDTLSVGGKNIKKQPINKSKGPRTTIQEGDQWMGSLS